MSFERLEKISLHSDYYVVQMDWTMRDPDYFLDLNTESQKILFLVGVFEEIPDRFFSSVQRDRSTFCALCTFTICT